MPIDLFPRTDPSSPRGNKIMTVILNRLLFSSGKERNVLSMLEPSPGSNRDGYRRGGGGTPIAP